MFCIYIYIYIEICSTFSIAKPHCRFASQIHFFAAPFFYSTISNPIKIKSIDQLRSNQIMYYLLGRGKTSRCVRTSRTNCLRTLQILLTTCLLLIILYFLVYFILYDYYNILSVWAVHIIISDCLLIALTPTSLVIWYNLLLTVI